MVAYDSQANSTRIDHVIYLVEEIGFPNGDLISLNDVNVKETLPFLDPATVKGDICTWLRWSVLIYRKIGMKLKVENKKIFRSIRIIATGCLKRFRIAKTVYSLFTFLYENPTSKKLRGQLGVQVLISTC